MFGVAYSKGDDPRRGRRPSPLATVMSELGDQFQPLTGPNEERPIKLHSPSLPWLVRDKDVRMYDVLGGRGSRSNRHPGNLYLRHLANVRVLACQGSSTPMDRKREAVALIGQVQARGGRFLKPRGPNNKKKNAVAWELQGIDATVEKVTNLLRDRKAVLVARSSPSRRPNQWIVPHPVRLGSDSSGTAVFSTVVGGIPVKSTIDQNAVQYVAVVDNYGNCAPLLVPQPHNHLPVQWTLPNKPSSVNPNTASIGILQTLPQQQLLQASMIHRPQPMLGAATPSTTVSGLVPMFGEDHLVAPLSTKNTTWTIPQQQQRQEEEDANVTGTGLGKPDPYHQYGSNLQLSNKTPLFDDKAVNELTAAPLTEEEIPPQLRPESYSLEDHLCFVVDHNHDGDFLVGDDDDHDVDVSIDLNTTIQMKDDGFQN